MLEKHGSSRSTRSSRLARLARQSRTCRVESSRAKWNLSLMRDCQRSRSSAAANLPRRDQRRSVDAVNAGPTLFQRCRATKNATAFLAITVTNY